MSSAPNYPLAVAIARAGWSNAETARRINDAARRNGHHGVAVDHTRVGRWIRYGECPRDPVPCILASLLNQHSHASHTPVSLGLVRGHHVRIVLDADDHAALLRSAAAANVSPADYTRRVLRQALREQNAEDDR
ncbi:hypothetical protein ACIBCO_09900 [Streptomyces violascens]|uniref:hypothetical protein n=1 Tax=Streptomyces violascens TaxID=67381 RepID=UPI0037AC8557